MDFRAWMLKLKMEIELNYRMVSLFEDCCKCEFLTTKLNSLDYLCDDLEIIRSTQFLGSATYEHSDVVLTATYRRRFVLRWTRMRETTLNFRQIWTG